MAKVVKTMTGSALSRYRGEERDHCLKCNHDFDLKEEYVPIRSSGRYTQGTKIYCVPCGFDLNMLMYWWEWLFG